MGGWGSDVGGGTSRVRGEMRQRKSQQDLLQNTSAYAPSCLCRTNIEEPPASLAITRLEIVVAMENCDLNTPSGVLDCRNDDNVSGHQLKDHAGDKFGISTGLGIFIIESFFFCKFVYFSLSSRRTLNNTLVASQRVEDPAILFTDFWRSQSFAKRLRWRPVRWRLAPREFSGFGAGTSFIPLSQARGRLPPCQGTLQASCEELRHPHRHMPCHKRCKKISTAQEHLGSPDHNLDAVFACSWKLPAYSGDFLLTIMFETFFAINWSCFYLQFELFCLQLKLFCLQ